MPALRAEAPVFAVHAKTLVVDRRVAYVGTYNLDPRSENLNTEVGVVIHDAAQAAAVADAIETDMLPGNSWNAASDDPRRPVATGSAAAALLAVGTPQAALRGAKRWLQRRRTSASAASTSAVPASMASVTASPSNSQPQSTPSTGTARPTVSVRDGPMSRIRVKKGR